MGRQLATRCGARVRRGKPQQDQEEELDIVGCLAGWACMGVSRVKDGVVARLVVQVPSDMTRLLKSCLVPIEEELGTEVFQGDIVQRSGLIDPHTAVLTLQSSHCNAHTAILTLLFTLQPREGNCMDLGVALLRSHTRLSKFSCYCTCSDGGGTCSCSEGRD